jgi:cytochrome c5
MKQTWIVCVAAVAFSASAGIKVDEAKLPPAAQKTGVTFDKDIKPIFQKACVQCHGPEKQKAKLRLDSLEWVVKGAGSDGHDVLSKGKSGESALVHAVSRLDEDLAMPPEGKVDPLTRDEVGLIRAWIDQGAN